MVGDSAQADLDPEEFRNLGYRAVDMIADYYRDLDERAVYPGVPAGEVAAAFEEELPESGGDPESILEAWSETVVPYATHNTSPRFFGFVMGGGTRMGTLAEALAATVNMNVGGWKPAPSGTEIERRTVRWLAEMVGYPADCGGLLTSGGTMANVTAILAALRNTADYDTTAGGLQTDERSGRYTLYMADHEGHSSIVRTADVLNLGRDAVRLVPSREDFTMDPDALAELLDEDEANGDIPFCVVAQVGSINVGAVDPLEAIADVCAERGLWFHADGACGAVGAILPEKRHLFRGLERADSVTLDPHKWLSIPYECGCVLVADGERLRRSFSMDAPYLRDSATTEEIPSYFDSGPQMSRGFRALKLWMTMKHLGLEGYRTRLARTIACAEHLDQLVRGADDFEAVHEPTLYIYSFHYAPSDLRAAVEENPDLREPVEAYLADLHEEVVEDLQDEGLAYLTTTEIRGRTAYRLSICNHRTTPEVIDAVFEALAERGADLDRERRADLEVDDPDLRERGA